MGRTKKRSKAKSASARTRVEDGQDGASESAVEVARRENEARAERDQGGASRLFVEVVRRQNESSIAAKLPTKVLERIIAELCPSTFGFDNHHYAWALSGYVLSGRQALKFALVCKSWRTVGLAAHWRHAVVLWRESPPALQLVASGRQSLELTIIAPETSDEHLMRVGTAAATASIGEHLRALCLWEDPAVDLLARAIPTGGFPSLVELHICLWKVSSTKQACELFAHMPRLEYLMCAVSYGGSPGEGTSARPSMPAPRRRLTRLTLRLAPETPEAIEHGRVELEAVADLLYVVDLSALRELKVAYNFSHAVPFQLTALASKLRILRLGVPAPLFPSFPAALTSMLADLPHLVALDVEIMTDSFGRDVGTISPSDAASLLAALPLSLEVALVEFDFSLAGSAAHLSAFLERRLALGVLKRWTSVRGSLPDATLKTTWRRYGGGGGGGECGGARWETEDFDESEASPRIV